METNWYSVPLRAVTAPRLAISHEVCNRYTFQFSKEFGFSKKSKVSGFLFILSALCMIQGAIWSLSEYETAENGPSQPVFTMYPRNQSGGFT